MALHFYCSSQPCGNATIKKWARASKPRPQPGLSPDELPLACSSDRPLQVTAREEGQVGLLAKNNDDHRALLATGVAERDGEGDEGDERSKEDGKAAKSRVVVPPGTCLVPAPPADSSGFVMTCR